MLDRAPDDTIVLNAVVELDWLDWLRVLFGHVVHVQFRQPVWIKRGHRSSEVVLSDQPLLAVMVCRPGDIHEAEGAQIGSR